MKNKTIKLLGLILTLMFVIACGTTSPKDQSQNTTTDIQSPVTTSAQEEELAPTPTILPVGMSRENPFPEAEVYAVPNWELQILDVKRGDEAWQDIQAANMFNSPASEGMQFILLNVHAKSMYSDSDEHSISYCDFSITGSSLQEFDCSYSSVVPPDPSLDGTLYSGGETEGWVALEIPVDETNLLLIFNESWSFEEDTTRFIMLDPGASIKVPVSELDAIKSTDEGIERGSPAPKDTQIITEDWIIKILEVIRGDGALQMVINENSFNDPPDPGMEYIAVRVYAKYIGIADTTANIDESYFKTTGSENIIYDWPSVVNPSPSLSANLFPGGETEGWIVLQASQGETGIMAIFEPWFSFSDADQRFVALE